MASTAEIYPNSPASTSAKTSPAQFLSDELLAALEAFLPFLPSEQDIRANAERNGGVPSEFHLAAKRARAAIALAHAGMELSVAGPNPRGVSVLLPGCHVPNDDGRPTALNCVSAFRQSNARVGEIQPGPVAGAVFAPAAARVGKNQPGISGTSTNVSGEGF